MSERVKQTKVKERNRVNVRERVQKDRVKRDKE